MFSRRNSLKRQSLHLKSDLGSRDSGHLVDKGTFSTDASEEEIYTPWVTKLNKHKGKMGKEASILEVAFTGLALLYIKPGLTPRSLIVVDEVEGAEQVFGVASESYSLQVKNRIEVGGESCYSLDSTNWQFKKIVVDEASFSAQSLFDERIKLRDSQRQGELSLSQEELIERMKLSRASEGVHFMDKMPADFFHTLLEKHNNGEVLINMESLASIFAASFVLEEDDLHKGNIGFYITEVIDNDGKIKYQFNFFKIDHDMMMMESIMSQKDMRFANLLYNQHSFKISTRDLEGFPDLVDSGNHYWPTKKRFWAKGDKAYSSKLEIEAFANLKKDTAFINAKWKYFLKAAIVPIGLVEDSLMAGLDPEKDFEKIDMVRNAVWLRIANLKQKMLNSKEFKSYLMEHGESAYEEILKEIKQHMTAINTPEGVQQAVIKEFNENFNYLQQGLKYTGFSRIQKSILLDCYTFPLMKKIGSKPTSEDIDFVMNQFEDAIQKNILQALKLACIAEHLIHNSSLDPSNKTIHLQKVQQYKRDNLYAGIKNADDFLRAADAIHMLHLPLKQQKLEIFALLKATSLPVDQLNIIKGHLLKDPENCESIKFIKQLRSELWIIRKIKGTYGKTSTAALIMGEIESQIKARSTQATMKYKQGMHAIELGSSENTNPQQLTKH